MFYCCFFLYFFINARSLRSVGRSLRNFATRSEACSIYKCWSKNLGVCPPKEKNWGGGKNMLNLARFRPPSHFERKCFRNGWRYPKSENLVHYSVPSRVQRIKVGKFWCTNHGDLEVQLYPQNRIFWNTIFRPLGGAPP